MLCRLTRATPFVVRLREPALRETTRKTRGYGFGEAYGLGVGKQLTDNIGVFAEARGFSISIGDHQTLSGTPQTIGKAPSQVTVNTITGANTTNPQRFLGGVAGVSGTYGVFTLEAGGGIGQMNMI